MLWVLGILGVGLAALVGYWLIVITEGVYLGQKMVTHLYDRVAEEYDDIKEYGQADEHFFLSVPLSQALGDEFEGIILDVAAGTGRVASAMSQSHGFYGRVIGVDHSAGMLRIAKRKMPHLSLVQADAMQLPFSTESVEAVTCLEAMEFLTRPQRGLEEMARVLKPEGVLLTTNRVGLEARLMPGKSWSRQRLEAMLTKAGLVEVVVRIWETVDSFGIKAEKDAKTEDFIRRQHRGNLWQRIMLEFTTSRYQKVWARKPRNPSSTSS